MMTDAHDPITVRIQEACRMTGIGRSKLYQLIQEGEIGIVKVGAMTLVPVAELRAFLGRAAGRSVEDSMTRRPSVPVQPATRIP